MSLVELLSIVHQNINPFLLYRERRKRYERKQQLRLNLLEKIERTHHYTPNYNAGNDPTPVHLDKEFSVVAYKQLGAFKDRGMLHLLEVSGGGTQWDVRYNKLREELIAEFPSVLEKLRELFKREFFTRKDFDKCFASWFDFLLKER